MSDTIYQADAETIELARTLCTEAWGLQCRLTSVRAYSGSENEVTEDDLDCIAQMAATARQLRDRLVAAPPIPLAFPLSPQEQPIMHETPIPKAWYQSRTIWAGLAAVVIALLGVFQIDAGGERDALTEVLMSLGVAIAGGMAIYGRIKAQRPISRSSVTPEGSVAGTLAWAALACLLFLPLAGCTTAREDRGALGYTAAAIDIDFNFDGINRQSQPHVPLTDASNEPAPDVAALQELVRDAAGEGAATSTQQADELAQRRANVLVIGTLNITVTGGNEAKSRDSGGQNADGPSTTASLPVQLNTAGGAGTQGDTASTTAGAAPPTTP